ncbi:hypothetical protein BKA82DRAFT_21004 [Pisolithus tinctorius]|uniref:Uncharacterized protein n=1 Tax=Pisolithus tinctorius Marx 270 TaxID=870435 RepID=A0A0C3PPC4_PISTI|nr:hypothetical protein BKA82DRAFT_21004 [Pisolithus tinctorius]KIO10771.1 hypothetical protein M404DRAFT_21004 [Pisolithus tinctorius Marx 270]
MRLSLLGSLALVVVAATAAPIQTNAERLARGLPPLPPANVARGVDIRGKPSPVAKRGPHPSSPPAFHKDD